VILDFRRGWVAILQHAASAFVATLKGLTRAVNSFFLPRPRSGCQRVDSERSYEPAIWADWRAKSWPTRIVGSPAPSREQGVDGIAAVAADGLPPAVPGALNTAGREGGLQSLTFWCAPNCVE